MSEYTKCRKCGIQMIQSEERSYEYKCPKCGHGTWVFSITRKELKKLGREAYLDGRHWNHGGGLNK